MFGEDSGLKEAEGKRQLEALKKESLRRELGIGSEKKFEVNAHIITFKVKKIPPIFQRFKKNSAELSSRKKRFLRNLALTAADTKSLEKNRLFKVFWDFSTLR